MNTKFFKSLATVAVAVLTVGCAKEQGTQEGPANVTFEIENPVAVTKAIGDGTTSKQLYYQVFDAAGNPIAGIPAQWKNLSSLKTTVSFQLVKDQKYNFIFWAQTPVDGYYTIDETEGLKKITADYSTHKEANDENRDAFFAVEKDLVISGPVSKTVTLTRPLAQVNIGTLDKLKAGTTTAPAIDLTGATSKVVVKDVPTVFAPLATTPETMFSGASDVTFQAAAVPTEKLSVKGVKYDYLAMNYVFAPAEGTVCDLTAEFSLKDMAPISLSSPATPLKRNYRTNILGSLLTSTADFIVVVDPAFAGDEDIYPLIVNGVAYKTLDAAVAAAKTGEQTIIALNKDMAGNGVKTIKGQDVVIDLGGHTFDIDGSLVGSAGTETNGFQLLKGSKVTFKNGMLKSKKAKLLIQNYSDLTLENVTLDATGGEAEYVLSNNHGTVKIIGSSSILAPEGKHAFDVYYWPPYYSDGVNVYVNTTGTIRGAIEYACAENEDACNQKASLVIDNAVLENSKFETTLLKPNVKIARGVFADETAATAWLPDGYKLMTDGDYYKVLDNSVSVVAAQDKLNDLLANAPAGEKLDILLTEGTYALPATVKNDGISLSGVTGKEVLDCSTTTAISAKDATISNFVVKGNRAFEDGSSLALNGANAKVKGCKFEDGRGFTYGSDLSVSLSAGAVATISDCDFRKSGFRGIMIWNTGAEVKIDNCLFDNTYPFNCDAGTGKITVTGCELNGWTSYTNTVEAVSFTDCRFGKSSSGYAYLVPYCKTVLKDCVFSSNFLVSPSGSNTFTIEFINCKLEDGSPVSSAIMDTEPNNNKPTWIIDGVSYNY